MRTPTLLACAAMPAAILALCACSPIMLDDEGGGKGERRLYVNDRAPNDSLPAEILREGVKFVLQPGKPYELSVATDRTGDVLDVYTVTAGGRRSFKKVSGSHDGVRQVFTLSSPLASASFYQAYLLTGSAKPAPSAIRGVALESQGDGRLDTLRVKLFFMQALRNLGSATAKEAFAASFFGAMNQVLRPHGIVVAGISESVDPNLDTLDFPFTNLFVPLAGTRTPNHAHLYLVNSIVVGNPDTGPQGEVLGFAAREVVDISEHRESRVILSNRGALARLAVTAVHELGHFFGLRHTVSTRHDILQDEDASNVEDGFTDTRFCRLDQAALGKTAAGDAGAAAKEFDAGPYCLRIADNSCTESSCDLLNLMHPVECLFPDRSQTQLSIQQVAFLKRNMALYRR